MKLIAHVIDGHQVDIRPAPVNDWMEATNQRFAYRCLPLNIANAYGWEVPCPCDVEAYWTGRGGTDVGARRQRDGPWHPSPSICPACSGPSPARS